MKNTLTTALLLLFSITGFGQSSYNGLTPGTSTRVEAERILGGPQKKLSPTLIEYKGGADATKIYVQFADESPAAEVLRVELFCESGEIENSKEGCGHLHNRLVTDWWLPEGIHKRDADLRFVDPRYAPNHHYWYGAPVFAVYKFRQNLGGKTYAQWHIALYSRELYESAVPTGCTGMFSGTFDTNRGRLVFTRTPPKKAPANAAIDVINLKGNYSTGSGTISAQEKFDTLEGEWKDATGSGTFSLKLSDEDRRRSFTGEWLRTSGKGPKKGSWEGKCVDTK